jgi:myo-inositol 2-dehydrogenase/D-chiro-inositol 1-dehydrogenase
MSLADALAMEKLARETNIKYMVGFTQRFRKGYQMMKDTLLSGALGDPVQFICVRIGPGPGFDGNLSASWRTNPDLVCGMSIESLSHDIDFITSLLGPVSDVQAAVTGTIPALPAFDNNIASVLRLGGGSFATIAASWGSAVAYNCKTLVGTKGTLTLFGDAIWDFATAKAAFVDGTQWQQPIDDIFLDGKAYLAENEYFVSCVREDRKPECDAKAGREALKVSLAMLSSSREKRLVAL